MSISYYLLRFNEKANWEDREDRNRMEIPAWYVYNAFVIKKASQRTIAVNTTEINSREAPMHSSMRDIGITGLAFLTGLLTGLGTGILMAPRSGKETLGRLHHLASDVGLSAGRLMDNAKETAGVLRNRTRRLVF